MASSQVNPKNKKDTMRDMFDDSHADADADTNAEEGEELDDSVKDLCSRKDILYKWQHSHIKKNLDDVQES